METYQRSDEAVLVLDILLQCILLVVCTRDDLGDPALAHVFENGLDLVGGWLVLGDVELELLPRRLASSSRCRGGRSLLQEVGDPDRGRRARLVKERDNIEGFVLGCRVSALAQAQIWVCSG